MRMFLRPRWLLTHALIAALAVAFVSLGVWQLQRLEERRSDNAKIAQNLSAPEQSLADALEQYGHDPDALIYRRVRVSGRYLPADEVLLTPRQSNRQAGHHVVTPLELDGGSAVLVERGWVPFAMDTPPVAQAAPPDGEVEVSGILFPTRQAARSGTRGGGGGRLTYLSTVDVDRIQPQVTTTLLPVSILLQQQDPPAEGLPVPGAPPEQSEGSHQSYAMQWFFFTAILLGGYPLLLRRSWRARQAPPPPATADDEEDLVLGSGAR
jgi:surfeit locus 1 family protein